MDEVKIVSEFTRGILSRWLSRLLWKKLGCSAEIRLNGAGVEIRDGKTFIHLDADAEIENSELLELLRKGGLESPGQE